MKETADTQEMYTRAGAPLACSLQREVTGPCLGLPISTKGRKPSRPGSVLPTRCVKRVLLTWRGSGVWWSTQALRPRDWP